MYTITKTIRFWALVCRKWCWSRRSKTFTDRLNYLVFLFFFWARHITSIILINIMHITYKYLPRVSTEKLTNNTGPTTRYVNRWPKNWKWKPDEITIHFRVCGVKTKVNKTCARWYTTRLLITILWNSTYHILDNALHLTQI